MNITALTIVSLSIIALFTYAHLVGWRVANAHGIEHTLNSRVWLDGVEVTNDAYYANEGRGYVGLYKTNETGNKYIDFKDDPEKPASEIKYGSVVIRPHIHDQKSFMWTAEKLGMKSINLAYTLEWLSGRQAIYDYDEGSSNGRPTN